jgi:hypothetical protein
VKSEDDLETGNPLLAGPLPNPRQQRLPCLLGDFKLYRSLSLLLHDGSPRRQALTVRDVPYPDLHEIAGSQLAVDGKVEQSELTGTLGELQSDADGPDLLKAQR